MYNHRELIIYNYDFILHFGDMKLRLLKILLSKIYMWAYVGTLENTVMLLHLKLLMYSYTHLHGLTLTCFAIWLTLCSGEH